MPKRTLSQDILRNSFYNLATTLIGRVGGLLFTIVLARLLLPEDFGIYSLALTSALIWITILDVGVNSALLKFTSSSKKLDELKNTTHFKYLLKFKLFFSILVAVIFLVFSNPISNIIFSKPNLIVPLRLTSFYLILLSLESFLSSLFFIFNDVKILFWKESFSQALRVGLILLVPLIFAKQNYVSGTFIALILGMIILTLLVLTITRRKYGRLFKHSPQELDKKQINNFIFYVALGSAAAMIFSYIDILMIGAMIPDASYIGYYRAATTLVFSIAGLLTFSNVLLPKFTNIKDEQLDDALQKVLKYTLGLSIPAAAGVFVVGRYLIRIVYGYAYLEATYPLFLLSLLIPLSVASGILYAVLSAKGKPEIYTKASALSLTTNVVLNFMFINMLLPISALWATVGAAIATAISYVLYTGFLVYFLKKSFNLKFNGMLIGKQIFCSILMAIFLIGIQYYFIKDMTLFTGGLLILLGIIFYFALMLLVKGFTRQDLEILNPRKFL